MPKLTYKGVDYQITELTISASGPESGFCTTEILDSMGREMASVPGQNGFAEAVASAMAAAPDLLESANEFLPILERQLQSLLPSHPELAEQVRKESSAWCIANNRVKRLRAAIAKAEGRLHGTVL